MKRKYAEYYWTTKETDKGWIWNIYSEFKKGSEVLQSSLDNDDEDDKYFETQTAAAGDAIEAIQEHYS